MTPAALKLVADFEDAAKSAQHAEAQLRKSVAEELARIERERAFGFRRTRLIRLLASSSPAETDEETALATQARALCGELSWSEDNPAHKEILTQLEPVGRAVWQCACGPDEDASAKATRDALNTFENWFESARGQPFYTVFDHHIAETPVVDF